jgi:hypothetical protein
MDGQLKRLGALVIYVVAGLLWRSPLWADEGWPIHFGLRGTLGYGVGINSVGTVDGTTVYPANSILYSLEGLVRPFGNLEFGLGLSPINVDYWYDYGKAQDLFNSYALIASVYGVGRITQHFSVLAGFGMGYAFGGTSIENYSDGSPSISVELSGTMAFRGALELEYQQPSIPQLYWNATVSTILVDFPTPNIPGYGTSTSDFNQLGLQAGCAFRI